MLSSQKLLPSSAANDKTLTTDSTTNHFIIPNPESLQESVLVARQTVMLQVARLYEAISSSLAASFFGTLQQVAEWWSVAFGVVTMFFIPALLSLFGTVIGKVSCGMHVQVVDSKQKKLASVAEWILCW